MTPRPRLPGIGLAGGLTGRGPRVLLLGMMGAGKTTVGIALAALTGWPHLDNDELVARATGLTAADVLATGDEAALRQAEARALEVALREPPPLVAGVAAGVVVDPRARRRLRDEAFVVYLRAPLEVLAQRVARDAAPGAGGERDRAPGTGAHRPWLGDDPEGALTRLFEGREALYLEAADLVLDVDTMTPAEAARRIVAAVR